MLTTFGALAPVFLIIALGWGLRARGFPGDAFWPAAERLVYWLLFPALLLMTTASADLTGFRILPITLALIGAILLTAALAVGLRHWLAPTLDDAGFTSMFQGAIRTNTYVGLAGAVALYGEAGLAVVGIVVCVVVTTVNVLSVIVLIHYGAPTGSAGWRQLFGSIASNPLILACLGGFFLNAAGLGALGLVGTTIEVLGRASLPLGLLCVGAGLELDRIGRDRRAVALTSGLKLLVMPSATALFCWMLEVEGVTAASAVLFTSVPVSASSYVLARQLGGDAPLVAGLITVTTLAAVVTMPLVLAVLV